MRKIVSVIKPFVLKQNLFIYEDGNKIDIVSADIEHIEKDIVNTAKQFDVTRIELVGSKSYLKGIQTKIEEEEMTLYDKKVLEIKIIGA